MEKQCNKCRTVKPVTDFFKDKNNKTDGYYSICKECKQAGTYKWREENKDRYNKSMRDYLSVRPEMRYGVEIKRRYGCTLEQYNQMLLAQEGKCALCSALHNPAVKKGRLFVDHCHKGGQVRALLCSACNSMLGYAKDDPAILVKAIDYLAKHK